MSFNEVLKRFELLSSLEGKELSRYYELCRQSFQEIKSRLKVPESSLSDGEKLRLSYIAGALAFYRYCLYTSVTEPVGFSAGEVSVNMGDKRVEAAKRLFEEEYRGLSSALRDSGFYFGRVRA